MESARKTSVTKVMPILFSFFVMGFCDVVGISTTYVKNDFNLSEALAGFIPSMVFLWFLLLSVPVALAMNRVGRKRTVQISNVITIVGMLIPFVSYNFATCMVAFALLGIGNTILQVSLNPLLTNVVSGESLTSSLTAGQVVKAVSSFMGPIIAVFAVNVFGNWQYLFPIFAAITLLSSLWLMMTSIPKEEVSLQSGSSVGATFSLLKDSHILLFFIGILCTVGLDVGMNTLTPKLLIERCGLEITDAGLGSSIYFFCRTAGAFIGAFLLARLSDVRYLRVNLIVMLAALGVLYFANSYIEILICVGVFAFALSCVFSIVYSLALRRRPDKANEISGLMITGVCGGAIIPPLMGLLTETVGSQVGSLIILTVCAVYLTFCAYSIKSKTNK